MTLSGDALWLLDHIDGASQGADGRLLEAGAKSKTLQDLVDMKLIHADEKGRYRLTTLGQSAVHGGKA